MKIKIDKNLIATYISLDNKKANEYLANLANQIKTEVIKSSGNDEVFEYLNLLTEFVYKVPRESIEIVRYIIENPKPAAVHKSPLGEFKGKSHGDLVLKCIELLGDIRYIDADNVLKIIAALSISTDSAIKSKALEVVRKFTKYDFNVLTKSKIGYGAQKKALDFVLTWSAEDQFRHIDFIEAVLKEVLNTSVEGTTNGLNEEGQYTITMRSGVVAPSDFLKKIRREAIDLAYELYQHTDDPKLKLKFIEILDQASHTPSNAIAGEDVMQMITEDLRYLTGIYRKIVFGNNGKMIDQLAIVAFVEEHLYWIHRSEKRRVAESEQLRSDILNDDLYGLYRLLVGDDTVYREQEGWDTAEKNRNKKIDDVIASINEINVDDWFEKFTKIANQHVLVDKWKFNPFNRFIQKLTEANPQISDVLLTKAFEANSSLKHFSTSFLTAFRKSGPFDQWDKFVEKIIATKDNFLVSSIIFSLNLSDDADLGRLIRESDIELLEQIEKQEGRFAFLNGKEDRIILLGLFNTLARNFKRSTQRIEPLIVDEIKRYPKYLSMFFTSFAFRRKGWIEIKDLHPATIEFLKEKVVDIPDIDWHVQELLLDIGRQHGLKALMDVFLKRIQKEEKTKGKKERRLDDEIRYEVIPYHFNPDLSAFISEHEDYVQLADDWMTHLTTDWSLYNWNVSHFLQRIGKGFDELLESLIKKGDDNSLLKAARAMHSIEDTNFDLCIEIVRRTDNKKAIDQVDSNMYTTGVVGGEYGLANAYEAKAEALEKYKSDESERVKKFVERMTKSFRDSAKRERQRADEEKQLRKIEFEG